MLEQVRREGVTQDVGRDLARDARYDFVLL